ncbi:Uncharacterized protein CEY00_Acc10828 [Actinidia chinensis var. chinensis]|uniref:Uncharacterized protein n=1 Tax=Actinidia chinensis var. chinensis TaxID=1590841 RepID=A0A2R6R6Y2_ACTCC|nr:Uncharacterized protein CEY00_Acc10828 [Actinidia chinensis var. chinensis]
MEVVKKIRYRDSQWYDLRWKTWQAGLYDLLAAACSNFLAAASFSSRLVCTKYLIHQEELRSLAFIRKTKPACYAFEVKPSVFSKGTKTTLLPFNREQHAIKTMLTYKIARLLGCVWIKDW